jgi:hypothetical protein
MLTSFFYNCGKSRGSSSAFSPSAGNIPVSDEACHVASREMSVLSSLCKLRTRELLYISIVLSDPPF